MGYSQDVTLALTTSETTTPIVRVGSATAGSLQIPSTASLILLEYYSSNDGVTFSPLRDLNNSAVTQILTASTAAVVVLPDECFKTRHLRIKAAAAVEVLACLRVD